MTGFCLRVVYKAAMVTSLIAAQSFGVSAVASDSTGTAMSTAESTGSSGTLEEIVVTAEKRQTNLQDTPISITALNSEELARNQVSTLSEMQSLVPDFQMGETDGYAQITIRGIGIADFTPGAESAVAVNLNEVYVSRPIAQATSLYDLADLEVLRGPQGTLYGRNATAGAVNITTARPTDTWSGYARTTVGNFGELKLEAAAGGPVVDDTLYIRVAAFHETHRGYGDNLVTGNDVDNKDAYGIRGTVVFKPTNNLTGTLIAEYYNENDNDAALHYFGAAGLIPVSGTLGVEPLFLRLGGYTASNPQDVATAQDSKFMLRTTALTGILEWSAGPFGAKSITGYRGQSSLTFTPLDGGSTGLLGYVAGEPEHQFSEELQLHYDTRRLHLTGGLYYFRETDTGNPGAAWIGSSALGEPGPNYLVDFVNLGGTIRTDAKAAFAQGTFELVNGLSLTAGLRYSRERKDFVSNYALSFTDPLITATPEQLYNVLNPVPPGIPLPGRTFDSTTPKFGIQYEIDPNKLVYATYAKGFKSGSFDMTTTNPAFAPETLTDYELGLKTTAFDNRLRTNVSAFYYDYNDLQVQQVIGLAIYTTNAAKARLYGAEAEVTAIPVRGLTVNASASYLHARYVDYFGEDPVRPLITTNVDFSGNYLNNAPSFRAHFAPEYKWEAFRGSLALRAEADYTTRFYFTPGNYDLLSQGAFVKANAFLTFYSPSSWQATIFVRNIGNISTRLSGVVNSTIEGNPVQGAIAPPRTYGAELTYRF
jgi:iron complex outermembrane recepter protein